MQQSITFQIGVSRGFSDIRDNIFLLIKSYDYEMPFGEEDTYKRINAWSNNIVYDAYDQESGIIKNFSDSTMYEFDYTVLFPQLFYDLADVCPEACFSGHSEYYNDDYGIMEEHNFVYPQNERKEEKVMIENFNKDELIGIIRKILNPLTAEEISEVCEYMDIEVGEEDIPAAIYDDAVDSYDESLDGIMEYIYNNLINAVINVAGEIIYDGEWNSRRG